MKNQQGFTVIELIVYMALFSLVIGGLLLTTYSIIESNSKLQSKVLISEEGAFLLRKIDWALNGATNIVVPPNITPVDSKLIINNAVEGNLTFQLNGNNIELVRGVGSPIILNSESVQVADLVFTYDSGQKTLRTQFTLTSLTQSQLFDTTKYIRQ